MYEMRIIQEMIEDYKDRRDHAQSAGNQAKVDAQIICLEELLRKIDQENPPAPIPENFTERQVSAGADPEVAGFIHDILTHNGPNLAEYTRRLFRSGYCWHFAHMLKDTFGRGSVCWTAPFGHFIWLDDDGNPYDVEGLYFGEAEHFIPEEYLENLLEDFKHIPDKAANATEKQIQAVIDRYVADQAAHRPSTNL